MTPLNIGVIVGSTRPQRRAPIVAEWVLSTAREHDGLRAEVVDIDAFGLPLLDEPIPAIRGPYEHPHTIAWAEAIGGFDAYVIVTPEYNHSMPGALKNAIDFLYDEWKDKPAGFVSYGADAGGARAVEHLRGVMGEVHVADVRTSVALSLLDDVADDGSLSPREHQQRKLREMLDELVRWGRALRSARSSWPRSNPASTDATPTSTAASPTT